MSVEINSMRFNQGFLNCEASFMKLIKRFTKYEANIFELTRLKYRNKTENLKNSEVMLRNYLSF